jgi:hypothetical protein
MSAQDDERGPPEQRLAVRRLANWKDNPAMPYMHLDLAKTYPPQTKRELAARQWLADQQYDAYVRAYVVFLAEVSRKTGELSAKDCLAVARFMLAGVDGLILQELAKPNQARSKRGIEVLIAAAQIYARSLVSSRTLD